MTGQKLYEEYAYHMENQGVGVDTWDDLDETDQIAWNATAEELS